MNGKKKILVVDDSATVRKQLAQTLESFEVHQAESGELGLAIARELLCDLAIVDVNMPGMSGIELVAELRRLDGYSNIPIFVVTTESAEDLIGAGKDAGATAWIIKPFNPSILLRAVKKVLNLSAPAKVGD
jgi:two-component system, chemotaxis family, chemotaxis protein CheY